ncbi:MAG TPA: hypothetical protein IGS37_02295 [Synechococcales cyanobacterium M55_K2018_004]|nr:hypothetical protein [Synechococcales cyanobacterium M55_K2018_004]
MNIRGNGYSRLFNLACQVIKYFLLFVVGFTVFWVLASVLSFPKIVFSLLLLLWPVVMRIGLLVLLLMIIAIVVESIQS